MVDVAGRDRKRSRADRVELGPAEAAVAVAVPHAHVVRRGSEVGRGEVEMAVAIEVGRDDAAWAAARGDAVRTKGERLSDGERGAGEPDGERTQHRSHRISPHLRVGSERRMPGITGALFSRVSSNEENGCPRRGSASPDWANVLPIATRTNWWSESGLGRPP